MRYFPSVDTRQNIGHRIATVGLAPLLVAQGLHVRRSVVRLDEPPGARFGSTGSGPTLRLLIAGDSAAAGVGATTQQEALSGQLAALLGRSLHVRWKLLATTGHAVRELIGQLHGAEAERFDVALVSIGVNDVTSRTSSTQWVERQATLIGLLKSKFGVRHILLSSLPPMHAFPALPQPLRWYLGARAAQLNGMLRRIADADAHCEFLPIDLPLERRYMAADGFHPGALAYLAWAQAAARAIRRRVDELPRD